MKFNDKARDIVLGSLRLDGQRRLAAAAAGVTWATVRNHRDKDAAFKEQLEDAFHAYHESLEVEAVRRGRGGVEQEVFHQGIVVGTRTVYSDSLLAVLLKARQPGFADKMELEHTGKGGVLVVGGVAPDAAGWAEQANTGTSQEPAGTD